MLRYGINMHQKDQPKHLGTIVVLSHSYLGTSLHTRSPGPQLTSCNVHTNICMLCPRSKIIVTIYLISALLVVSSRSTIICIHSVVLYLASMTLQKCLFSDLHYMLHNIYYT